MDATTTTALQECLHCVGIAIYQLSKKKLTEKSLMDKRDFFEAYSKYCVLNKNAKEIYEWASFEPSWTKSVVTNVNELVSYKLFNSVYTIYRGDGMMTRVYEIFQRISRSEGVHLPNDKWNPGDIWLFSDLGGNVFNNIAHKMKSLAEYNMFISDQLNKGDILGISLKKTKGVATVDYINNAHENLKPKQYKFVGLSQPTSPFNTGVSLLTSEPGLRINVRSFSISDAANVRAELIMPSSAARHGKRALTDYEKSYHIKLTSKDEIRRSLSDIEGLKKKVLDLWASNGYRFDKTKIDKSWEKLEKEYKGGSRSLGYFLSIINSLEFGLFLNKHKDLSGPIVTSIISEASSKNPNSSNFLKVY